jgi:hypothetical protein
VSSWVPAWKCRFPSMIAVCKSLLWCTSLKQSPATSEGISHGDPDGKRGRCREVLLGRRPNLGAEPNICFNSLSPASTGSMLPDNLQVCPSERSRDTDRTASCLHSSINGSHTGARSIIVTRQSAGDLFNHPGQIPTASGYLASTRQGYSPDSRR